MLCLLGPPELLGQDSVRSLELPAKALLPLAYPTLFDEPRPRSKLADFLFAGAPAAGSPRPTASPCSAWSPTWASYGATHLHAGPIRPSQISTTAGQKNLLRLTPRERVVLARAAAGQTNSAIAQALFVSPGTVRKHLEHIYDKLEVRSRTQAAAIYIQQRVGSQNAHLDPWHASDPRRIGLDS